MSETKTYTVPGVGGSTLTFSFNNTPSAGFAAQIVDVLFQAKTDNTLDIIDYSGTGSVPTVAAGHTQELVLEPSIGGSINVPSAQGGAPQVLVITNSNPITIHGSSNLSIVGGGPGNVTFLDPASIILADQGGNTGYTDLVSVPAADSPYTLAMRDGAETVYGSGSGTISGGLGANYVNVTAAAGGSSNVILSQGVGDTVLTGSGNATVTSTGTRTLVSDGPAGTFVDNDQGFQDTIAALDATLAAITIGGSHALTFGGADSISYLDTGVGNTISARISAFSVTTAGSGALVWGLSSSSFTGLDASTGSHDTIVGANAPTAETLAGTSAVFAAQAGATSIVASGNSALIFGGTGTLALDATGDAETIVAGGGTSAITASGASDLIYDNGGALSINAAGSTDLTVAGGSATETVNAGSASKPLVYGPTAGLDYIGGPGSGATVVGQGTADTISAGAGGLIFGAGAAGSTTITGSSSVGGVTMFGGSKTALTYASSLMGAILVAGSGAETLDASRSSQDNTFWGGQDTAGADVFVAGSGNDTLIAGRGTGSLIGGNGADLFAFVKDQISGAATDTITGFTSSDQVALFNYGASAASSVLKAATVSGGNTVLALSDGTQITFAGYAGLTTNNLYAT